MTYFWVQIHNLLKTFHWSLTTSDRKTFLKARHTHCGCGWKCFRLWSCLLSHHPLHLPSTLPSILWQSAWTFAWLGAPGCISMPCAGYWLGQMLSSPHQHRLSACGNVWLFDVTCVSLSSFPSYFAVFHLVCASSIASNVASGPAAVSCAWCFFASHLPCKTNWCCFEVEAHEPLVCFWNWYVYVHIYVWVCLYKACRKYINVDLLFTLATKFLPLTDLVFITYSQSWH